MADKDATTTASKPASAVASTKGEGSSSSPFHVLMLPDGKTIDSRREVDETLRHDYLGKRYEAYKTLYNNQQVKERVDDPVWSGAKTVEKWLIFCCEMPELTAVDQADFTLPGALRRDRVLKFVGYLALYCHDVVSRALAISILERTLEADLPAMQAFDDAQQQQQQPQLPPSTATSPQDAVAAETSSSPTTRNRKRTLESKSPWTSPEAAAKASAVTILTPPPRKPDRLWQFLAAGGLKILDQWIEDASKPVSCSATAKPPPDGSATTSSRSSRPSNSKVPALKESPTGAILLPLLKLLRDLPFDKQLVKQSKINRQIRNLSKEMDALVEAKKSKKMTHPRAGGYPIVDVQEALNDLKSTWMAAQKKLSAATKDASSSLPDPFQAVHEALEQRLDEIQDFKKGKIAQPSWLEKAWKEPAAEEPPAKKKRTMTTEEMSRIDHKRERILRTKEDLQKAEEENRKYQERLRQMKQRYEAQLKKAHAAATEANRCTMLSSRRRKVRWTDGLTHVSNGKKRELLEQVFVFVKNTSAASGLVAMAEEEEEYSAAPNMKEGDDDDELERVEEP